MRMRGGAAATRGGQTRVGFAGRIGRIGFAGRFGFAGRIGRIGYAGRIGFAGWPAPRLIGIRRTPSPVLAWPSWTVRPLQLYSLPGAMEKSSTERCSTGMPVF
jgi:hypothetical protein